MADETWRALQEVQYFELSSTNTNIYSASSFEYCGLQRLLVASRNLLLSLGSEWGKYSLQELPLRGVPDDAEIVSLTGFVMNPKLRSRFEYSKVGEEATPVIAIAYSRAPNDQHSARDHDDILQRTISPILGTTPTNSTSAFRSSFGSTSNVGGSSNTSSAAGMLHRRRYSSASHGEPEIPTGGLHQDFSFFESGRFEANGEVQQPCFMNLYYPNSTKKSYVDVTDLTHVTQVEPQAFELDFVPLKLTHTNLPVPFKEASDGMLIVSGTDSKLHYYRQKNSYGITNTSPNSFVGSTSGFSILNRAPTSPVDSVSTSNNAENIGNSESSFDSAPSASSVSGVASDTDSKEDESVNTDKHFEDYYQDDGDSLDDTELSNIALPPQSSARDGQHLEQRYHQGDKDMMFENVAAFNAPLSGFNDISSPLLSFCAQPLERSRSSQVFAGGSEDGILRVVTKDLDRHSINDSVSSFKLNGPLTCLNFVNYSQENGRGSEIVVGGAKGFAAVMECPEAAHEALNPSLLPGSDAHDSVMCCKSTDLNWDGTDEILLGTYGQQLLAYSKKHEGANLSESCARSQQARSCPYEKSWERQFAYPIFSIESGDYNQDGLDEVVVNTLRGVHILQPDLVAATETILDTVHQLEQLGKGLSPSP